MGIGKRAKILNAKQQTMVLAYLENTRYPLRNEIMFLLSFKAGLRAKEISQLTWSDRKSTRLNSSHSGESRMPSSA